MMSACSHGGAAGAGREDRAKIEPEVVREAVVFEPGTKDGAVVPEISAPNLRAIIVEEKIDGNRLIERHREWILEGDVQLLGIPKAAKGLHKASATPASGGGSHED